MASVTFISKDQAMEDFKDQYPEEELFQDLDPEILEDRYAIQLVDLERQRETVERSRRCPASPMSATTRRSPAASSPCGTWPRWCAWP